MVRRRFRSAVGLVGVVVATTALVLLSGASALARPPQLVSAVSRMNHTGAGTFDVQLPLTGGTGIECRDVSGGMTIALKFDQAIKGANASITAGAAKVAGQPTINTDTLLVNLTGVKDAQALNLRLANITNGAGEKLAAVDVPFRVLFADVNASAKLSDVDANLVRLAVWTKTPVRGNSFRGDVNHDGVLNAADITAIVAAVNRGGLVTGADTGNTAPTISVIPDQQAVTGLPSTPAGF
jgi:hypothetical protein